MAKRGISFYLVRFIAGGLLLLLLVSAETAVLRRTVLAAAEPFSMTALEVTDDITVGWNLGNSLDSFDQKEIAFGAADLSSETVWGNPLIIRELITSVRESGFNVVRLPVTWYTHMDPETYEIDPAWMARVREVVDFILDEGMYCILNVHHDTGVDGWLIASEEALPRDKEILTSIWEQLCEEFGDYGDRLIFEGYNEILDENKTWDTPEEEGYEVANELNQLFVDVVRASGGNNAKRILFVNTYCASCMTGVVIAVRNLRHSEGSTVTVEIIDFKEDELEYMQILFDRIPSLPQALTLRDFGIVSHLWHNIAVRLSRTA